MPEKTEYEVSIGKMYEQLDEVRGATLRIGQLTTEIYEKQIAGEIHDLNDVVSDLLYLVREHLSCHDCKVVDHTHWEERRVEEVYDNVVEIDPEWMRDKRED